MSPELHYGMTPEHEAKLADWRAAGGLLIGPPPLPPCPYCHAYDFGCPLGGCNAPRTRYSESERAAFAEDVYEEALIELAHLDDAALIDVRDLMPHPERVPSEVETVQTMGELRARIRALRGDKGHSS